MPRIVDGDNLLGSWPGRRRSDGERRRLAHEIARLALEERRRITVVFDGTPAPEPPSRPDVRFAGPGRKADDVILEILRETTDRRGFVVVTNDRSLADQSRHLGARVERCDVFRKRLLAREGPEKPDALDDLGYWSEVFHDE